ncbi:MAG: PAS domain S-box protein [Candidatus Eisenbacteria bacterium]|nr:PAS domain S-box protein [Candidatus Eisenbacteria bacterium]
MSHAKGTARRTDGASFDTEGQLDPAGIEPETGGGPDWMHRVLARTPPPRELAAVIAPGVKGILGRDAVGLLTVYERQLHDSSYMPVSQNPGGGIDPAGARPAIHLPEARRLWSREPQIQRCGAGGRNLFVPAFGFRELCGFIEIVPVNDELALDSRQETALLWAGQAAGLCLERHREELGTSLRQEALQALVGFLGRFADRLADGILISGRDGALLQMNRSAERMTGLLGINVMGEMANRALPAAVARVAAQQQEELKERGRAAPQTVEFECGDGRARWRVMTEAIRSGDEIISYVVTLRDLEDQQRLMRLLELDRLKNDFLSTLSHELRTPMTTLRGYTWLLRQEQESLPVHLADAIISMDRESASLCKMVDNLLYLADPEGVHGDDTQAVPVGAVVVDVVQEYRTRAKEKKVRLGCDLTDEALYVRGDAGRLRLMLANVVDNAIKYSPSGGAVDLSWGREEDGRAMLVVADEGPGITQLVGSSAFDAFHQGGDALVGKPPGMGLGLAVVRRVVEEHSGRLDTQIRSGGGTQVAIALPLIEAATAVGNDRA